MNEYCSSLILSNLLIIIKNCLNVIQIIGPILAMIFLTFNLIKLMNNPDDKKIKSKIKNSLISLIMLFIIPIIVNTTMLLLDESFYVSRCWNNVGNKTSVEKGTSYIEIDSEEKKTLYDDSTEYEKGKPKEESSSETNSSSSNAGGANKVIYVGDSRTVQMYAYLNNDWSKPNYSDGGVHEVGSDIYVAQGGMGLNWMKSTGIPAAKKYCNSNTAIVILMGVNDLNNANNYVSYINQNYSSWNCKKTYFVSVNPCEGNYSNLNSKITSFNQTVKSGKNNSIGWIETNSTISFKTTDGLHYDKTTYSKLHDYIKTKV